jgi:putative two-component system response regulator
MEIARRLQDCLHTIERAQSQPIDWHERAVGRLSALLGGLLGLASEHMEQLNLTGSLHDIGKLGIPEAIRDKPGAFSPGEEAMMRQHCRFGFEVLRHMRDPVVDAAAEIALHHHERWDGSGYPDGLAGNAISLDARIVSLCDVYAAIREERTYHTAMTHETAMLFLLHGTPDGSLREGLFDPDLLAVFAAHAERFAAVYDIPLRVHVRRPPPPSIRAALIDFR